MRKLFFILTLVSLAYFNNALSQVCPKSFSLTSCCAIIDETNYSSYRMVVKDIASNEDPELNAKVTVSVGACERMYVWITKDGYPIDIHDGNSIGSLCHTLSAGITTGTSWSFLMSLYGYGVYHFYLTSGFFTDFNKMKFSGSNNKNGDCYKDFDRSTVTYAFGQCLNVSEGTNNCNCTNDVCAFLLTY